MPEEHDAGFWKVVKPAEWPKTPEWMTYSMLMELESCPRRWALNSAEYPNLWEKNGYPHSLNLSALEGTLVHSSLQQITSAIVKKKHASFKEKEAVTVLKELGGYTQILKDQLDFALSKYRNNPRVKSDIDDIKHELTGRIPLSAYNDWTLAP